MLRVLTSPRMLALHLLAVVAVTAATLLGFWQLEAWEARRAAEARDLAGAAPLPLQEVMGPDDPYPAAFVGQPVEVTGEYVDAGSFLVGDRVVEGRSGYWVVTPLAVCASGTGKTAAVGEAGSCADEPAVPVVRGWTARAVVPPAPEGTVALTGWLQPPEGSGARDDDPTDDVLPELRIADAIQRVDQDLYGAYLIARDAEPGLRGVSPDSLPEPETFTALRNLLYAIEWWVFAAFALFVWGRWVSDEVARQRGGDAGVPSAP